MRRKPSALYGPRPGRAEPGERVFCGPEFVIRAREKPRRVDLTQVRWVGVDWALGQG